MAGARFQLLCTLCIILATHGLGHGTEVDREIAAAPAGAGIGVAVYDCESSEWLFRHGADEPRRLASVTKLYVSAAALLHLGADYRFATRAYALGPISAGTIPGLGIVGGGSPCLDEHFTDGDPDRILRAWAAHLQEQGVTRIAGDVVIDGSRFSGPIRPASYPEDHRNAQRWYTAPASAFAFNDNCIDVVVSPTTPGQPARATTRPASALIPIHNRTHTVGSGSKPFIIARDHHGNRVVVSGRSRIETRYTLSICTDPDLVAGEHLVGVLRDAGLTVNGTVRRGRVAPEAGRLLIDHHDPLLPALTILNQRSQNFYGEQILRVLGHDRLGQGSTTAGVEAVSAILAQHLGLDTGAIHLVDGSGLGYENRASADAVCRFLAAMNRHAEWTIWRDTLKEVDTASGPVLGKTGTLAVARCLAGYVEREGMRPIAYAILLNRGDAGSIGWARDLRQDLIDAIAARVAQPGGW